MKTGQRVICIDESPTSAYGERDLKRGNVYTVRWAGVAEHPEIGHYDGVLLEEFDRGLDPILGVRVPFDARRFAC